MFHNESLQEFLARDKFEPISAQDFPLAQVLSSIRDGIVVVDRNGVIVYINPSYTRISKIPMEQIIGTKMEQLRPDAGVLEVLKTGVPILQRPIYLENAKIQAIMDTFPLYQNTKLIGAVTIFREVDRYYSALEKLGEAKKKEESEKLKDPFKKAIGSEQIFIDALKKASAVSPTSATILLRGENGVGKEVFAEAIHLSSGRASGPFVKINCSAIPESLIESELFGYENGAFTGAKRTGNKGKFEQADGGTIFLDEIGDMPLHLQAKLLRVLQEREFERIGGNRTIKVDIRVIAATNQNLEELVENQLFREDLYYRLNVIQIQIPPLRERPNDIGLLSKFFILKYSEKYGKRLMLSDEALQKLKQYHWPGNVRQLSNAIEHGVILCNGSIIRLEHLPNQIIQTGETNLKQPVTVTEDHDALLPEELNEKNKVLYALKQSNYNRTKAMEYLGISRRTFYKKIAKYNIQL